LLENQFSNITLLHCSLDEIPRVHVVQSASKVPTNYQQPQKYPPPIQILLSNPITARTFFLSFVRSTRAHNKPSITSTSPPATLNKSHDIPSPAHPRLIPRQGTRSPGRELNVQPFGLSFRGLRSCYVESMRMRCRSTAAPTLGAWEVGTHVPRKKRLLQVRMCAGRASVWVLWTVVAYEMERAHDGRRAHLVNESTC